MRALLPLLLVFSLLAGCQTPDDGLSTAAKPTTVSAAALSAIAGDMVSRLAEQIGTASSSTIKMDGQTSDFAVALEAALKGWGYSLVTDGKVEKGIKPIALEYSIASVDGQVLAQVSTPTVALGRAYTATPAGATPASPLSIMQRN
ncbi:conjugal transfer protein TrbH [Agrobacterium tumefaciens]|uniref:conjugal transfer protein TrbH n=1 Tax=Agrobacterium tumefaciens TaxID=358 RepID=UPI001572A66F|nr:conjugal transfer protein TrbH [Agrobacterium tumefaciens]MCZ7497268.1 conjugal transfer protein TrbH [Rhizobium rhizogenes]NTE56484.1 conjugal transfer protein TrbH [Agrobacterium tumefaciens]NTE74452.1 conjugal transfer protein TrbH [Agrobacterium tumefaciens]